MTGTGLLWARCPFVAGIKSILNKYAKEKNKQRTGGEILFKFVAGHVAELSDEDCVDEAVHGQVTFLGFNHSAN